jgi:hypothetical protein
MASITVLPTREPICYDGISSHIYGGYCMTTENGKQYGCSTMCCLPVKIVLCLPCHVGALINTCLNYCCHRNLPNKNYLF